MELQAASLVFGVNIVVHQAGQPAWNIRNFPKVRFWSPLRPRHLVHHILVGRAYRIIVHLSGLTALRQGRTVHLSYHDNEHYNSVRLADDFDPGPASLIPEAAPASATVTGRKARSWGGDEELRVSRGTGCLDPGAVQRALQNAAGNVDQVSTSKLAPRSQHTTADRVHYLPTCAACGEMAVPVVCMPSNKLCCSSVVLCCSPLVPRCLARRPSRS